MVLRESRGKEFKASSTWILDEILNAVPFQVLNAHFFPLTHYSSTCPTQNRHRCEVECWGGLRNSVVYGRWDPTGLASQRVRFDLIAFVIGPTMGVRLRSLGRFGEISVFVGFQPRLWRLAHNLLAQGRAEQRGFMGEAVSPRAIRRWRTRELLGSDRWAQPQQKREQNAPTPSVRLKVRGATVPVSLKHQNKNTGVSPNSYLSLCRLY